MMSLMSPLLLALTLATAGPTAEPTAGPAAGTDVAPAAARFDEGELVRAVEELMLHGRDAVRVAVAPVDDADAERGAALEQALVRALLARQREEVLSPALLRARLRAQAEADELHVGVEEVRAFSADHLLLAAAVDEGGESGGAAVLYLQLVWTEGSEVLGEARAPLGVAGSATSASAPRLRGAVADVVEPIATLVESRGVSVRTHRLAVVAPRVSGAAQAARVDRFVQAELAARLRERGFLLVERARLAAALDQAALAQALDESEGVKVGRMLGADSVVVSAVDEAGASFLLTVRVVDVASGAVLGAASATLPREGVVTQAEVETRTPLEAGARSLLVPGWGQAYNGQGTKGLLFGVGALTAAAATALLGGATVATSLAYDAVAPGPDLPPAQASAQARELFERRSALLFATAVAGGVTAMIWGGGVADALASAPHAEAP